MHTLVPGLTAGTGPLPSTLEGQLERRDGTRRSFEPPDPFPLSSQAEERGFLGRGLPGVARWGAYPGLLS